MYATGNTSPNPSAHLKTYTYGQIPTAANHWTGDNASRYSDPTYDKLWQQAIAELEPATCRALFAQMSQMLVAGGHVIPLVHRAETAGASNR